MKEIRDATPQARHHFTQADQVNQLVSASEADPDRDFMARMMDAGFKIVDSINKALEKALEDDGE